MTTGTLCWNCGAPLQGLIFCPQCGVIQAPNPSASAFEVLGLEVALDLDENHLSEVYLKATRSVHPDFFALAEPEEKERSLQQSAVMTDAYRTLKTFEGRCREIILTLGLEQDLIAWKPSPGLLMQVLEWNEELDECSGPGDPAAARIRDEVETCRKETMRHLGGLQYDAVEDGSNWVSSVGRFQYLTRLETRIAQLHRKERE